MTPNTRSIFEYLKDEGERPFLLAAFEGKLDDAKRVAYAELLDSRDPTRAEWLRLEMKLQAAATDDTEVHKRYRELSRGVGYEFVRLFRRNDILNCGGAANEPKRIRFAFICEKRWETLLPTDNASERHCNACNSSVYHCSTVKEAEARARAGHCIAVSHMLVENAAGGGYRNAVGRPDPIRDWGEKLFLED